MNNLADSGGQPQIRHLIYWLIIVTSIGGVVGRIWGIQSRDRFTPMLSANDRSRWCTIRALIDDGTFVIDNPVNHDHDDNGRKRYPWDTIDKVEHLGADGEQHFYSSKPPLFPTILAGEYWILKRLLGYSIGDEPFLIMRIMIVLTNVVPLLLYLLLIRQLVERYGTSDWGRIFVMACAAWGTLLTTFSITINNHLPAAISVAIVVACLLRIWHEPKTTPWWTFATAGLFAAFAAANELPAASFFGISGLICLWKNPIKTLVAGVPAAIVVVVAFFGVNYVAHNSLRPPYVHRGLGKQLASVEKFPLVAGRISGDLKNQLVKAGVALPEEAFLHQSESGQWALSDKDQYAARFALIDNDGEFFIHQWDNWYDYPTSYWIKDRTGVDAGESSRLTYLFHCLIGHHGIFSLTPIWILSLIGMFQIWQSEEHRPLRFLAAVSAIITVVVLTFYIMRPVIDRNYGGVSSGLRWTFWMIPLWLVTLIPAVDKWWQHRWFQITSLLMLAVSVATVLFPMANPWTNPWLFDLLSYIEWIDYP